MRRVTYVIIKCDPLLIVSKFYLSEKWLTLTQDLSPGECNIRSYGHDYRALIEILSKRRLAAFDAFCKWCSYPNTSIYDIEQIRTKVSFSLFACLLQHPSLNFMTSNRSQCVRYCNQLMIFKKKEPMLKNWDNV